jgi:hypothetical protein
MSNYHHGHAFTRELLHNIEHLADHFGIKRGGRLIKNQKPGL